LKTGYAVGKFNRFDKLAVCLVVEEDEERSEWRGVPLCNSRDEVLHRTRMDEGTTRDRDRTLEVRRAVDSNRRAGADKHRPVGGEGAAEDVRIHEEKFWRKPKVFLSNLKRRWKEEAEDVRIHDRKRWICETKFGFVFGWNQSRIVFTHLTSYHLEFAGHAIALRGP
jgi:hypothetical protein